MAAVYKIIVSVLFVILGLFGSVLSSPVPQGYGSSHAGPPTAGSSHAGPPRAGSSHLGPAPNTHLGPSSGYGGVKPVITNF
ncbi:hypothetical protein GWI33_010356 [Rhynchophorus ferrugineus]|uniref:Uncharacterized protein n=1 Tax=Rhynchophorus ferrugineus TaxID=354439 RepID=A0A834ME17_RHYFE|nr:hypothetical protein GWI33_010356 [Rhynchophorus ferrugineus]